MSNQEDFLRSLGAVWHRGHTLGSPLFSFFLVFLLAEQEVICDALQQAAVCGTTGKS